MLTTSVTYVMSELHLRETLTDVFLPCKHTEISREIAVKELDPRTSFTLTQGDLVGGGWQP